MPRQVKQRLQGAVRPDVTGRGVSSSGAKVTSNPVDTFVRYQGKRDYQAESIAKGLQYLGQGVGNYAQNKANIDIMEAKKKYQDDLIKGQMFSSIMGVEPSKEAREQLMEGEDIGFREGYMKNQGKAYAAQVYQQAWTKYQETPDKESLNIDDFINKEFTENFKGLNDVYFMDGALDDMAGYSRAIRKAYTEDNIKLSIEKTKDSVSSINKAYMSSGKALTDSELQELYKNAKSNPYVSWQEIDDIFANDIIAQIESGNLDAIKYGSLKRPNGTSLLQDDKWGNRIQSAYETSLARIENDKIEIGWKVKAQAEMAVEGIIKELRDSHSPIDPMKIETILNPLVETGVISDDKAKSYYKKGNDAQLEIAEINAYKQQYKDGIYIPATEELQKEAVDSMVMSALKDKDIYAANQIMKNTNHIPNTLKAMAARGASNFITKDNKPTEAFNQGYSYFKQLMDMGDVGLATNIYGKDFDVYNSTYNSEKGGDDIATILTSLQVRMSAASKPMPDADDKEAGNRLLDGLPQGVRGEIIKAATDKAHMYNSYEAAVEAELSKANNMRVNLYGTSNVKHGSPVAPNEQAKGVTEAVIKSRVADILKNRKTIEHEEIDDSSIGVVEAPSGYYVTYKGAFMFQSPSIAEMQTMSILTPQTIQEMSDIENAVKGSKGQGINKKTYEERQQQIDKLKTYSMLPEQNKILKQLTSDNWKSYQQFREGK